MVRVASRFDRGFQARCAHLLIWDPHDLNYSVMYDLISLAIPFYLPGCAVNRSVDLEHESKLAAIEVNYETSENVLSPELESEHPTVAKQIPGRALRCRRMAAKPPGELRRDRVRTGVRQKKTEAGRTQPRLSWRGVAPDAV
jgi:hypothetical protein